MRLAGPGFPKVRTSAVTTNMPNSATRYAETGNAASAANPLYDTTAQSSRSKPTSEAVAAPEWAAGSQREIRRLIAEIAEQSQSDVETGPFFEGFLKRVVKSLGSEAGVVWLIDDSGDLVQNNQINMASVGVHANEQAKTRHAHLLQHLLATKEATLFLPQSTLPDDDRAGNPTNYPLAVGVIEVDQQVRGLVEVFQPTGGGAAALRGYSRFLVSMCELASDFLRNRELRLFQDRQSMWSQLEAFIAGVHGSLDVRQTSTVLVNESRRLIDCDRVSFAATHAGGCKIAAVSGIDTTDARSNQIKSLAALAKAVIRAGDPLWFDGDADSLPPQIETKLHRYLDDSHSVSVAVLPVVDGESKPGQKRPEVLGALIVEHLKEAPAGSAWKKRAEAAAQHGGHALANAVEHNRLFLMPVWKLLGKATWLFSARTLPKTALAIIAVIALAIGMTITPWDFTVESTGVLRPVHRDNVFAEQEGKIVEVAVSTDEIVEENDVLIRQESSDLKIETTRLAGQLSATEERILGVERDLALGSRLSQEDQDKREDELLQLRETAENIRYELSLYNQQATRMTVRAPRHGQIVTWKVGDLLHRTIEKGQRLLTIADPNGGWEIELDVPEKRMCHLTPAARSAWAQGETVPVTFMLATHPGREFQGKVVSISPVAEVRDDVGNAVRVRVQINAEDLPELRDGSKVTARIHCGQQPVGYVVFHDLIETVWSKILFRL